MSFTRPSSSEGRITLQAAVFLLILVACFLLTSCTSLTPRVQADLILPPLPAEILEPCQEPEQLPDGTIASLYQQMLRDLQPWAECRLKVKTIVAMLADRERLRAAYDQSLKQLNRPWWKFWD